METLTRTPATDDTTAEVVPAASPDRVGTDLRFGGAILAIVIGGNLLWHASDAGILAAIGAR